MSITAADINKLRQQTGAGMMECKKALTETQGDFEKAIDYLRKKGQKVAELRGGRDAKEGVVVTCVQGDFGVVLRLSCETDFVAKNEHFIAFAQQLVQHAAAHKTQDVNALKELTLDGLSVAEKINEQIAKIGEKIEIAQLETLNAPGITEYIHGNYRLGVLLALNQPLDANKQALGKDIAMQVAAMNPLSVDEHTMDAAILEREKTLIIDTLKNNPKMSGKGQDMLENIAKGKLQAFLKEKTLLNQNFIKNDAQTVAQHIKNIDGSLKILAFKRISL